MKYSLFIVVLGVASSACQRSRDAISESELSSVELDHFVMVSGLPEFSSTETNFDLLLTGSNIDSFRYKLSDLTVDPCSSEQGYGPEHPFQYEMTIDIEHLNDGVITLCIVGKSILGEWQSFAEASFFSWIKETEL